MSIHPGVAKNCRSVAARMPMVAQQENRPVKKSSIAECEPTTASGRLMPFLLDNIFSMDYKNKSEVNP